MVVPHLPGGKPLIAVAAGKLSVNSLMASQPPLLRKSSVASAAPMNSHVPFLKAELKMSRACVSAVFISWACW